ncbi:regulates glutamine-repressible gene products [Scheffersomyces stipitis CBS 6054]|uniref:Regulates glutamine-repressible gene products n=1 Tax=Scheffersomyces stipitis (strain ATCC 58785 / CBS 6054 / NBRC 10063 / NRRL Y-11545) TaxID=322104 RepID=A3LNU1_PICST|nr:regulates glutamine-repressible gene products [Scheffersomyces stipitis CBS 6054]ABN64919.2 regulates glutamine-repressible gene products [Scheffersomyces stipitis CBS 6054]
MSEDFESGPSIVELFLSAKKLLSLQTRVENRQLRKSNSKSQLSHMNNTNNTSHLQTSSTTSSTPNQTFGSSGMSASPKHDKVLDLLSPLSIDDLKNSPYIPKSNASATATNVSNAKSSQIQAPAVGSNSVGSNSNHQNNGTHNSNKSARTINTPASMNDDSSPPNSNMSVTSSRHNSDSTSASSQPSASSSSANIEKEMDFSPMVIDEEGNNDKHISNSNRSINNSNNNSNTKSNTNETATSNSNGTIKSNLTSSLSQQIMKSTSPTPPAAAARPTECYNCHTLNTPLWRKDPTGNTLCNACGLFLKLHGTTRPLSLKTDVIKKRSSRKAPVANQKLSSSMPSSSYKSLSMNDQAMTNVIKFNSNYVGSIPIASKDSSVISSSNVLSNVQQGGVQTAPNSLRDGSLPRYKNVLILPKPSSSTNLSTGGSTPNTPTSVNMKSIPIPNQHGSSVTSPSSPYTPGSVQNANQQFKRKKSDINISGDYYGSTNSIYENGRRVSSTSLSNSYGTSLSNSYNKRGGFSSSSFQSSSFNRRTSMTNLQSQQRKLTSNSFSLSNSYSNNSNNNNSSNSANSLTSSNISLLNQRMTGTNNGNSFFDNPPAPTISRHNSSASTIMKQGMVSTPGSVSASSPSFHRNSYTEYYRRNPGFESNNAVDSISIPPAPLNVVDLLPSSRPLNVSDSVSSNKPFVNPGIDDEVVNVNELMDTSGGDNDFFKNFTSLQNDEFIAGTNVKSEPELDLQPHTSNVSTKSSLTDGLKNQKRANLANSMNNDVKDLDWLKFEI